MSLTSILKSSNNQALRDKFKTEFVRPMFNLKTTIKATLLTNNNGIVGAAFDYLVRFSLQLHSKRCYVERGRWVADSGYRGILNRLPNYPQKELQTGVRFGKWFKVKYLINIIKQQYKEAKNNHAHFLKTGQLTDKLIENETNRLDRKSLDGRKTGDRKHEVIKPKPKRVSAVVGKQTKKKIIKGKGKRN